MREILFRGKRVDNGEWVEGSLLKGKKGDADCAIIVPEKELQAIGLDFCGECNRPYDKSFEVFPETVGQFTGLTDKNGKKIFEGDIIRSNSERGYIEYYPNDCAFDVVDDHGFYWLISEMSNIEVIGNIHDNPELLEEK